MKLTGLVLGLLAAVCHAGSIPGSPQLAPISLFTQFQQPPSPAVMEALKSEVASILAPGGFRFQWFEISAASNAGISVELAVVTFRGNCDVRILTGRIPGQTQALGFTSVTDGEILPFTTVDCDRTRSFLSTALSHLPLNERALAYGRALGRILAHELYHVFANTPHHARGGVAKQTYTVADLMGEEFALEKHEFELLRSGRAYSVLAMPGTL